MPQNASEWLHAARLALWWPAAALAHPLAFPAGLIAILLLVQSDGSGLDGFLSRAVSWFLLCLAGRFVAPWLKPPPFRPRPRAQELPAAIVQPARTERAADSPNEAEVLARLPAPLQRFLAEERARH
jgi:hypothetical protein